MTTENNTLLRPLPQPDPDSAPFWEGIQKRQLLLQRCRECGTFRFPPGEICPHCLSRNAEWTPASGLGQVYSWIVVRHPIPRQTFADQVPYVVVLIDLEEGVRIASNLIDIDPEDIRDGMPVAVTYREIAPDRILHAFRPETVG